MENTNVPQDPQAHELLLKQIKLKEIRSFSLEALTIDVLLLTGETRIFKYKTRSEFCAALDEWHTRGKRQETELDKKVRAACEEGARERNRSAEQQKQSQAFRDKWQKLVVPDQNTKTTPPV